MNISEYCCGYGCSLRCKKFKLSSSLFRKRFSKVIAISLFTNRGYLLHFNCENSPLDNFSSSSRIASYVSPNEPRLWSTSRKSAMAEWLSIHTSSLNVIGCLPVTATHFSPSILESSKYEDVIYLYMLLKLHELENRKKIGKNLEHPSGTGIFFEFPVDAIPTQQLEDQCSKRGLEKVANNWLLRSFQVDSRTYLRLPFPEFSCNWCNHKGGWAEDRVTKIALW